MKILLHVCCGPCTVYPLKVLRDQGHHVEGYFYNPNIHPFKEFKRRVNALRKLSALEKFVVDIDAQYGLQEYLRKVVFHEQKRCSICYDMRLVKVAELARKKGFDAFSTTLLYSKYQYHGLLKEKCAQFAAKQEIRFHYEDFRTGWQEGIEKSKKLDLYRQPYCGCIYSEQERYDKTYKKRKLQE